MALERLLEFCGTLIIHSFILIITKTQEKRIIVYRLGINYLKF